MEKHPEYSGGWQDVMDIAFCVLYNIVHNKN